MKVFLKKCRREIVLFLLAALAWTGINVTQAFLLEYISETALEGISGRRNKNAGRLSAAPFAYFWPERSIVSPIISVLHALAGGHKHLAQSIDGLFFGHGTQSLVGLLQQTAVT